MSQYEITVNGQHYVSQHDEKLSCGDCAFRGSNPGCSQSNKIYDCARGAFIWLKKEEVKVEPVVTPSVASLREDYLYDAPTGLHLHNLLEFARICGEVGGNPSIILDMKFKDALDVLSRNGVKCKYSSRSEDTQGKFTSTK